ncbi:Wzz/FepE/Etk N-terminal domain-containing protein [Piscinibacter sakaiensis]|uniref:Tyrosine-protein kinase Wzc n=1 Tax=Piscinibacter sakaiensis TaxID=1547922 RepID=A0A0K8P1L2_PISS1|nr:Wzz/FepE/Etk N-terminal domain-containing protein [Piscinibacter sakaiensis]GAP36060.1 tyrosine-protein kinase Wzc [Piscinibacter sakaiensis]
MTSPASPADVAQDDFDDGPQVGLVDVFTWLGERKGLVAATTALGAAVALAAAFLIPPTYTARTTLLPPGSQQQSGSAAALASLGALGGIAGLSAKTPDELYVALLRSDSVLRALDQRYKLQERYDASSYERLRKKINKHIAVASEKRSGVITVEVEDRDPAFAAELANAHAAEIRKVLDRLAVSEAQQRRVFFEGQLTATKERLVKAEQDLRKVQERSGVIVLDKQAEALIGGAAQLRAIIAEREVQLKVLRTAATEQNPDVVRMNSELAALRAELQRLEAARPARGDAAREETSALDLPVGRLPEAALEYIRARREMKLQETLLENMLRQYEIAKLDEAKEGQVLQQIDAAVPPDSRSFPPRGLVVIGGTLAGLLLGALWVVVGRYGQAVRAEDPRSDAAWRDMLRAWRLRG